MHCCSPFNAAATFDCIISSLTDPGLSSFHTFSSDVSFLVSPRCCMYLSNAYFQCFAQHSKHLACLAFTIDTNCRNCRIHNRLSCCQNVNAAHISHSFYVSQTPTCSRKNMYKCEKSVFYQHFVVEPFPMEKTCISTTAYCFIVTLIDQF